MYNLTKEEKLHFILKKVKELDISAYEISKNTNLTAAGIGKILNQIIKNPHENSLNEIILFLEKKVSGTDLKGTIHRLEEPAAETYEKKNYTDEYISCLEERNKLQIEVLKLKNLLLKNNIEY